MGLNPGYFLKSFLLYLKNEQNPLKILKYFSYYSGEESIRGISLAYKAVTRHHSGIYICQADNGFGEPSQANLKLDVQRKFVHTFFKCRGCCRDGHFSFLITLVCTSPIIWYFVTKIVLTYCEKKNF